MGSDILWMPGGREAATPGEYIREMVLKRYGLTQGTLAVRMGVERKQVNQICQGCRAITPLTAMLLARVTDTEAASWLRLQAKADLAAVRASPARMARVQRARPLVPPAKRIRYKPRRRKPSEAAGQTELSKGLKFLLDND